MTGLLVLFFWSGVLLIACLIVGARAESGRIEYYEPLCTPSRTTLTSRTEADITRTSYASRGLRWRALEESINHLPSRKESREAAIDRSKKDGR